MEEERETVLKVVYIQYIDMMRKGFVRECGMHSRTCSSIAPRRNSAHVTYQPKLAESSWVLAPVGGGWEFEEKYLKTEFSGMDAVTCPPVPAAWIKKVLGESAYNQEGGVVDVLGDGTIQLWRYAPNQRQ